MKHFLLLLSFCLGYHAFANPEICETPPLSIEEKDEIVQSQISAIITRAETRDISRNVERLHRNIAYMAELRGITEDQYLNEILDGGQGRLQSLIETGYANEARHLMDIIENDSQFGDISAPLGELQRFAELQGITLSDYISPLRLNALRRRSLQRASEGQGRCSEVNYANAMGPVRDQDSVGWCMSFTLADMMSHRIGTRVSAFDVARRYYASDVDDTFYDRMIVPGDDLIAPLGSIESAFSAAVLTVNAFGTLFGAFDRSPLNLVDTTDEGVRSARTLLQAIQGEAGLCSEDSFPSEDYALGSTECLINHLNDSYQVQNNPELLCSRINGLSQFFPYADFENLNRIAILPTLDETIQAAARQCASDINSQRVNELSVKYIEPNPTREYMYTGIMENLNSGPVALGLNSTFLKSDQFNNIYRGDGHAVIAVGRRWDTTTNSCMILIRNSWGEDYNGEEAGWIPDPEHPGHVWVSEQALYRNVKNAYVLE